MKIPALDLATIGGVLAIEMGYVIGTWDGTEDCTWDCTKECTLDCTGDYIWDCTRECSWDCNEDGIMVDGEGDNLVVEILGDVTENAYQKELHCKSEWRGCFYSRYRSVKWISKLIKLHISWNINFVSDMIKASIAFVL